ncbi:MAG: hypothetical protein O7G85_12750, partial [Planctomycetota bacterium]|nr:hypothetical protein [Planctomycetota bacterium]
MNHDHRPSLRLLAMWGLIALLAITTSASARQDWSGRLDEALADESPRSWRGYFALGLQIADAENDAALNTLMNRWPTIDNIKFKQQLIKAMHFDLPTPYRTRLHPRVL